MEPRILKKKKIIVKCSYFFSLFLSSSAPAPTPTQLGRRKSKKLKAPYKNSNSSSKLQVARNNQLVTNSKK